MTTAAKDYYPTGELRAEVYQLPNGHIHYEYGAASKFYHKNGALQCESYALYGRYHREGDLPATSAYNENGQTILERYYIQGLYHREGGPAEIFYDGNGGILSEAYYFDGRLHNIFGPATIHHDSGNKKVEYYIHGKKKRSDRFIKKYLPHLYTVKPKPKTFTYNGKKYVVDREVFDNRLMLVLAT